MAIDFGRLELLSLLDEDRQAWLRSTAMICRYERGEMIIWAQDACQFVYFILEGQVEIFRLSPAGREQIYDRLTAGQCFNLVPACLGEALNVANARTLAPSRLLALGMRDFNNLMREDADFAVGVAGFLARRLQKMAELVENLSLYSVRQRLARFLIEQADTEGSDKGLRWTQTDMAKRLGTVRDVLGRALRKLADEGAVRFERDRILLQDRAKLEQAAQGED